MEDEVIETEPTNTEITESFKDVAVKAVAVAVIGVVATKVATFALNKVTTKVVARLEARKAKKNADTED